MDYDALLDAETQEFIRRTAEYYPDDAVSLSIEEQRQVYDRMCHAFRQSETEGIPSEDLDANGVRVRVYSAGQPTRTVIYIHGGGFVLGGLDSHDDVCSEICAQTGYRVVSIDYRLCPEHRHPAQFEDCWAASEWAADTYGDPIVLAGDSAGATLAACVAHHARGRLQNVLGQVLIYPGFGGDRDQGSYLEHAHAPMLSRADVKFYASIRSLGEEPTDDPTYEPLQDSDFSGLPPTVIITADCDPLRDDGRDYRDRLLEAGGKVCWINEEGLVHGYLRARHSVPRARASFERISLAIEALGQGLWPYD
ncbi:alpha/beta hydrolase [Ruegeria sp. 2012CJ41-6]|uniref:Alpha/beta hydrolase n=1 Tax=Ruegeria spongiae TaxID=2942209 RepID=A0ABT0Q034_9RHOB|nr:alpha/beta hydrolase [Ruegeria spongiae]MCL6283238.1 alpha/beta hydrolase [Ruegeria spongiae]